MNIHEEEEVPLLYNLSSELSEQKPLENAIKLCINENAEVVDSASQTLAQIRRELRGGEVRIREKLDAMIRSSSVSKMLQDQLITIRGDRFVIPVKAEYRAHFGGIVHDQSGSGATLFIEPESIVAMNNKLRETRLREEREIEVILQKLTALVGEQTELLQYDCDVLSQLDFIFAKTRLAREVKGTLPMMNDRGFMKLKKGRHPLIPMDKVVPIEAELGNQYTSIIVTGPNTGGKTVTLKTIGLLSLMAMSGLFVPAEDGSQLCVFDAIYADIGDEQSIEQNLSTFSSHMTNIISILSKMSPKSLVLLDEVGAGTDPAEGSALAVAILEHIHSLGCRMVATTHYSELKAYAYERKGVINASMEFDVNTLSPTYRLLIGVPGRSNAFAIAERLGLPGSILDFARGEVKEEDLRVEHMIASLEENRLGAEQEREKAEKLRQELESLRSLHEAELEKLEQQRDKRLEKAEADARNIIDKARNEAEKIIDDLRKLALEEGASVKEHKLIAARKQLDEAEPAKRKKAVAVRKAAKQVRSIEPGDEVKVYSLNQKGHVVELSGKEAVVQLGIMKMKVALDDLELIQQASTGAAVQQRTVTNLKRTRDDQTRTELDLRGANLEEAIMEVDRFIDEAFLSNLGQVYIIHGKGTGILRTGIQEYLRKHKNVKSYRIGNYGEGGTGVTVAELK
ncbi:Endonuclease MutS2 [compost metagenome]